MPEQTSTIRLHLLRLLYLLNFALLGLDVWPEIIGQGGRMEPVQGVAFAFWGALSLLSALGLRYPLAMLPLVLLQLVYKLTWLLAVALPQWPGFQSSGLTQVMLFGVLVDVVVIPWPYVVRNFVLKRGDRWRWNSTGNW